MRSGTCNAGASWLQLALLASFGEECYYVISEAILPGVCSAPAVRLRPVRKMSATERGPS